jgi:hypothetical protein
MDFSAPHTKTFLLIGAATVALSAIVTFSQHRPPETQNVLTPLNELSAKLKSLHAQNEGLKKRIGQLEIWRRVQDRGRSSGSFDATDESFQRIDSGLASFAVAIKDLRPYGDGTKVIVNVGNPSAATFHGVKLYLEYGSKMPEIDDPEFDSKMEAVEANTKKKEQELLKPVLPGSWNPNEVTLPGIKPDQLSWINIKLSTDQIALR